MATVSRTFEPATLAVQPLLLAAVTPESLAALAPAFAYESEEVASRNFLAAAGRAFREEAGLSENGKESRR